MKRYKAEFKQMSSRIYAYCYRCCADVDRIPWEYLQVQSAWITIKHVKPVWKTDEITEETHPLLQGL